MWRKLVDSLGRFPWENISSYRCVVMYMIVLYNYWKTSPLIAFLCRVSALEISAWHSNNTCTLEIGNYWTSHVCILWLWILIIDPSRNISVVFKYSFALAKYSCMGTCIILCSGVLLKRNGVDENWFKETVRELLDCERIHCIEWTYNIVNYQFTCNIWKEILLFVTLKLC